MKIMISSPDKEAEKHLLRVLAEVTLEVGREEAEGDSLCTLSEEKKEADDDKDSRRVLPCIDSIE